MATWVVTGAGRGIGLAIVEELVRCGDRVIATTRDGQPTEGLAALDVQVAALEVNAPLSIAAFGTAVQDMAGPVDFLVNNAGVLASGERFGALDPAACLDSFRVNALGPWLVVEALAARFADGARIANLSSVLGSIGRTQQFGTPSYAMSKAALNMATRQLSLAEPMFGRGIVTAALHPGWVRTDMGGTGAELDVGDAARALVATIRVLDARQSGRLLDRYGKPLPF